GLAFHAPSIVDPQSDNLPFWSLYGPGGLSFAGIDLGTDFTAGLPAAGTYVLEVTQPFYFPLTGPIGYTIGVTTSSGAATPHTGFGTVQSGAIAAGAQATFTFGGPAGLPVDLDGLTSSGSLGATITAPDGSAIGPPGSGSDLGPFLLPQSGTYTVTVQGSTPTDAGNYALRVLDLSAAPTLALATETKQTLL